MMDVLELTTPTRPLCFVFLPRSFYMAYNETPTDWTAMFKKRIVVDMSLVKTPKNEEDLDNEIAQIVGKSAANILTGVVEDVLRPAAKIVVGSIVIVTVTSAACKIAIKTTHNH